MNARWQDVTVEGSGPNRVASKHLGQLSQVPKQELVAWIVVLRQFLFQRIQLLFALFAQILLELQQGLLGSLFVLNK